MALAGWLKADNPDLVLLMMGINNIAGFGNTGNPIDLENQLQSLVQTIVDTKPQTPRHRRSDRSLSDRSERGFGQAV